jgi:hypothetical protein
MKWKLGQHAVRAAVVGAMASSCLVLANGSAHAAEGQWIIQTPNCTAIEKIELHSFPDGLHDVQAIDPTRTDGRCEFVIDDNDLEIYDSYGKPNPAAQSPWEYDGPGHHMNGAIIDWTSLDSSAGPVN